MLVLTRKVGEGIAVGDDIKIVVMQIKGKQVRLGIKADPSTVVHREEIYEKIQQENRQASQATPQSLEHAAKILAQDSSAGTPLAGVDAGSNSEPVVGGRSPIRRITRSTPKS